MKFRFLICLALVAAVAALGGCMQMHSSTVINKDGSGTASLTVSMSPAVAEALQDMASSDMGSDQKVPDFNDIKKDDLVKAGKKHGVKITKFSRDEVDGRQTLNIEMAFKDLKGLSFIMNRTLGDKDQNGGLGIFDAGDGNLVLRSTEYDFPADEEIAAETEEDSPEMDMPDMDPAKMQKSMEAMGKLMGAISELDIRMEFTVPGDIVSTNAPGTEGRTCIWTVNADNMMTAGQDMEPEIVFSGKGLKIKPMTD